MKKKSKRRLLVETLELREVMSATIFESEPNNVKAAADIVRLDPADQSALIQGAISTRTDQDFFRYRPTESGTIRIRIGDDSTLDTKITVEDRLGHKLFEAEPHNGVVNGTFRVVAGIDVLIRVRGQSHTVGNYSIALNGHQAALAATVLPAADVSVTSFVDVESNDTKATGNVVSVSADTQIEGVAHTARDRDFFVLRPTVSGTIQLSQTAFDGSLRVSIEDQLGNKLLETEPKNGVISGSFRVSAGKSYFMRVRTDSLNAVGYRINVSIS
jgi:hypothetical protein